MSTLERGYRRLLSWYPKAHRARHEEEMLGVLLAGATPGQERPSLPERADLLRGAFSIRLRHAFGPDSAPLWRSALGVAAVLAPVLLCLGEVVYAVEPAILRLQGRPWANVWQWAFGMGTPFALIALGSWLGLRRATAAAAWAWALFLGWFWVTLPGYRWDAGVASYILPAVLVAILVTTASNTPRNGGRLLAGSAAALLLLLAVQLTWIPKEGATAAWLAAGLWAAVRSPVGRRAALLLAPLLMFTLPAPARWIQWACAWAVVALAITLVAIRGARRSASA